MAHDPNTTFPYQATATFKNKYLKVGKHVAILPMDDALTSHIGRVTASWCFYETMFGRLIEQMLEAAKRQEPNWQRRSFKKRTELARQLLTEVRFPKGDEEGKRRIRKCLDVAADLQWRRNAIVHGSYRMTVAPHSSAAIFHADATHNGKTVSVSLDPDTLEKLWHDIAHLGGEFIEIAKTLGEASGLARSLPDKQILELSSRTGQMTLPMREKP